MNRVDYLKHRAEELRAEAARARDPKRKQELRELAQALERLAASTQERRRETDKEKGSPKATTHYTRQRSEPS
jgi:hypothetical protein